MGKYKPARGKAKKESSSRGAVPCVILLIAGMLLLFVLFYSMMKSGAS